MSLNAKQIKREPRAPKAPALQAGTYPARLVIVAGIGLQPQREYQGEAKPPKKELLVTYELLDEFMPDDDGNEDETQPRWFSENFPLLPLDSELAKSTKRYYGLDPKVEKDGEWGDLIGAPCNIVLTQKPNKKNPDIIYNNIGGVSSMRDKDAAKAPDLVNPSVVFDFYSPDLDAFKALPQWIQKKITEDNLDFQGSKLQELLSEGGSDTQYPTENPEDEVDW